MLTEFVKFLQEQSTFGPVDSDNANPLPLPEGTKLHSLEKLNLTRYRERYAMRTSSIDAFIEYTNKRGTETLISSVDPENCTARAIFNAVEHDEPGHCDDTAECQLSQLPDYRALQRIGESESGFRETQRGVIDWIHDWHENIDNAAGLVQALTKLSVDSVGKRTSTERDFGIEKSALEKIDIKAEGAEVPAEITFSFTPFDSFQQRTATLSLSARVRSDEICLQLRVRQYEQIKLAVAQEFVEKLNAGLSHKPFIGTIKPN